jgi:hypothetical protein
MEKKTIDDYLLNEMSESERQKLEDELVASEDLFFEIAERENELVDRYVNGDLSAPDLARFEAALVSNPARRTKVANARVLREFVTTEKDANRTITIAERSGFMSKLGSIFSFGSPAFQFASVGLILILGVATALLLYENRRLNSLESELASARQRESELVGQIENTRDTADELTSDLSAERARIEQLEAELGRLSQKTPAPQTDRPSPTIASLLLLPGGIRGDAAPVKRLEIGEGISRVAVSIVVPPDAPQAERVSVRLNDETVASSVRVRTRNDERSVAVVIASSKFRPGRNDLVVVDSNGARIAEYAIAVPGSR